MAETTVRTHAERGLLLAILLSAVTLVLEIAEGILSGSLALLSDAVHVLLDLLSLLLSYGAIRVASLPPTDTRTFGWHRVEVFAALINGLTMLAASCTLPTATALNHESDNPNVDSAGGSPSA